MEGRKSWICFPLLVGESCPQLVAQPPPPIDIAAAAEADPVEVAEAGSTEGALFIKYDPRKPKTISAPAAIEIFTTPDAFAQKPLLTVPIPSVGKISCVSAGSL